MTQRVRWAWVACFGWLAGCNQILGLDETLGPYDDPDNDSVLTADDNCPLTSNAGQEDTDHDGFGDLCDGCRMLVTPTNHDEDGDRVGDECDVCPGVADFQSDPDGDGVGNACSVMLANLTRLAFDPFTTLDGWKTDARWLMSGDSVAPSVELPDNDPGLTNDAIALRTTQVFLINVGVFSSSEWQDGDRFAVAFFDHATGVEMASCSLICDPTCRVQAMLQGVPASASGVGLMSQPSTRLWARINAPTVGSVAITCGVGSLSVQPSNQAIAASMWWPAVRTMPAIELAYFEAVQ